MKTTRSLTGALMLFAWAAHCITLHASAPDAFALSCPPDYFVSCEDEIWDLSIYGNAYIHTYKGAIPAGDPVVQWNLNACDVGEVLRTWSTKDYSGVVHSCTQTIHVSSNGGFDPSTIEWPENHQLEGCDPDIHPSSFPSANGYPVYTPSICSNIGVNYQDNVFVISPSCKKIIRKWTLIDWCVYNKTGVGGGEYKYFQEIKIVQTDQPDLSLCPQEVTGKTHNCEQGEIVFPALEVPPNSCGVDFKITNNSPYALSGGADISGTYPLGTTPVKYTIEYGCNKKAYWYVDVIMEDGSAPIPYCYPKLHVPLSPVDTDGDGVKDNGLLEIWAKDFDQGSYSLCGFDVTPSFSPDEILMNMSFDCSDVGENTINIYYHSANGNVSYCTVILDVQNNSQIPNCEAIDDVDSGLVRIAGGVKDVFDQSVEELMIECLHSYTDTTIITEVDTVVSYVLIDSFYNAAGILIHNYEQHEDVFVTSDTSYVEYRKITHRFTDDQGSYLFDSVQINKNYEVYGLSDETNLVQLDKCDLNVLVDHITGVQLIEDHQLLFAADVDCNDQVDFDDLKNLIFYLSGAIEALPCDKTVYVFPKESEQFKQESDKAIHCIDIENDLLTADFTLLTKGNLCSHETSLINPSSDMNILTSISEKLPLVFRTEIKSELDRIYSTPAEFELYPNPFSEQFVLSIKNPKSQIIQMQIFNANGKKVYRRSAFLEKGIQSFETDLSPYPSGVYFYQVTLGDTEFHGKAIKK